MTSFTSSRESQVRDINSADKSPALTRVENGALCAGCGACAALAPNAISMKTNDAGLRRPLQTGPLDSDAESRLRAVCPGLGQSVEPAGRKDHVLWGPHLEMMTGWSTDKDLRHRASSGGALSALARHLLETGQVDGVVQTMADPADPVGNIHTVSRTAEEIDQAAGSRYAPSAPLENIAPLLDGTETFAFVGKPCDIAAMRAWSGVDARIDRVFPVLIAFFCAGVPSMDGPNAILTALGAQKDRVTGFRYRGYGWPGRATATLDDGTERSMTYAESWGNILSKRLQHRCKICADATGKAADIACADAWETDEKGYPLFEEADGISLIVARTQKGAEVIEGAKSRGDIETAPFDIAQLEKIQPGQLRRSQALFARLAALRLMMRPVPNYQGMQLRAAAKTGPLVPQLRNFLGMIRRGISSKGKHS